MATLRDLVVGITFEDNASKQVQKVNNKMDETTNKTDKAGKASDKSQKKFVNFGKIGASAVAGLSLAVGGIVTGMAALAQEQDKAFGRMEARTGLTGDALKDLQSTATEVFNQGFGTDITTVADDVSQLSAMFGDLNKNELADLAKGAYTIGEAWNTEVGEVGKVVSTMTKTFDDLSETQAMDLITTAFQRTGDASGDLLDTFKIRGFMRERISNNSLNCKKTLTQREGQLAAKFNSVA